LESYKDLDSKYKFILLVSKRARQLLKGAKPKIKSKSKSLIRIAQEEVKKGVIDFRVIDEDEREKKGKKKEGEDSKSV
jgi:DNA-directed RNA polymerase subunit omega